MHKLSVLSIVALLALGGFALFIVTIYNPLASNGTAPQGAPNQQSNKVNSTLGNHNQTTGAQSLLTNSTSNAPQVHDDNGGSGGDR